QRNQGADKVSFYEILAPGMLSITLRASLLSTGALGGYYAITAWLPSFLKSERVLTVLRTSGYQAMVILGSYVGYEVRA
ncbi:MFS transporter, partial [Pseudomonas aeruginosa]